MQFDELWPGGPRFIQREPVFKLGTDAVLLAHFTNTARVGRAVDLGSGTGVLAVLLAMKAPALTVDCIDISPEAVALTAENAARNGLEARVRAKQGDMREIRGILPAGAYDLVVANPPYFQFGAGYRAKGEVADARDEALCTLDHLTAAAGYLLRWGGRFSLVYRPERLAELFQAMHKSGIEPKRLRTAAKTAAHAPSLVLVEGRRGGNPGLDLEAPLLLQTDTGEESPEIRAIYHRR